MGEAAGAAQALSTKAAPQRIPISEISFFIAISPCRLRAFSQAFESILRSVADGVEAD